MRDKRASNIIINYDRLQQVVYDINEAVKSQSGIFKQGWEQYLPPFCLPKNIEDPIVYQSIQNGDKTPHLPPTNTHAAAKFLFIRTMFDRRISSDILLENSLDLWENTSLNWLFEPQLAKDADEEELERIVREELGWNLEEGQIGRKVKENMQLLYESYESNPCTIIKDKDWTQAYKELQQFHGFGPGVAALYISELGIRDIVRVDNIETMQFKLDIHKTRYLFNADAVSIPKNCQSILHDLQQKVIGPYTGKACVEQGIDPYLIDNAMWTAGSKVCTKKDYLSCKEYCPVVSYCTGCAVQGSKIRLVDISKQHKYRRHNKTANNGTIRIHNTDGTKIDTRKNLSALTLELGETASMPKKKSVNKVARKIHASKNSSTIDSSQLPLL